MESGTFVTGHLDAITDPTNEKFDFFDHVEPDGGFVHFRGKNEK